MSLINAYNISLTFLEKKLFNNIGFQVNPSERLALIGPNGVGKTTLFRLIMGQTTPDKGEILMARGIRIGYLPQNVQDALEGPLLKSVIDSIPDRKDIAQKINILEKQISSLNDHWEQGKLSNSLAEYHHKFDCLETEFPRHEAEKILAGLGFSMQEFEFPITNLSGGWRMRAALASLLYQKPDLLLMDEPTNHLDIPAIQWLENYLRDFRGAIFFISHDRDFINRLCQRILSLENEGIRSYSGNYDVYLKSHQEEEKILEGQTKKQAQTIKDARKFIDRFRYKATKARQAQSKLKLLQKMEIVKATTKQKTMNFSFPDVIRSGREVISLRDISKGFNGKNLYSEVTLSVLRGDRVVIIGPNGCGKTTFLKIIAGEIEPDAGQISLGHKVDMSYFAQHHSDMLSPNNSIIDEIYQIVPQQTISFVRGVLGAFLFSNDEVDKKINILSGGEKARVSLSRLLVKPGNLMIMDEPTNHLDIISSEKLIDALLEFNGTLLFVSHNQSFINRLATKIWDIRENEVVEFHGNLDEYTSHQKRIGANLASDNKKKLQEKNSSSVKNIKMSRKTKKKDAALRRKRIYDIIQPMKKSLEKLEEKIEDFENRKNILEQKLADPNFFKDKEKSLPILNEYNVLRKELDIKLNKWEKIEEKLESTKKQLKNEEIE